MQSSVLVRFAGGLKSLRTAWLVAALLAATASLAAYLFLATPPAISGSRLSDVRMYRADPAKPEARTPQTEFKRGDTIQIGLRYSAVSELQTENALATFTVLSRQSKAVVFETNTFRLDPSKSELFVHLNNTSLPPGEYTVEVRDAGNRAITSADYVIKG